MLVERAQLGPEACLREHEGAPREAELKPGDRLPAASGGESALDCGQVAARAVEARVDRVELQDGGAFAGGERGL